MRLFDRITRLIKADAHGVVEVLEERTLLLKQYVREAELELTHKRARLDALRDDEKRLDQARDRCEAQLRALDEDIRLALGGGRDDLARFAIRRLIGLRGEAASLIDQLAQRRSEAQALGERIAAQQTQFDELCTRVRAELARATDSAPIAPACVAVVADEEVELELMRRRREDGAP
jgi:phage shock protein A